MMEEETAPSPTPSSPAKHAAAAGGGPPNQTVTLPASSSCPISLVTVYNDRAEIVRDVVRDLEVGTTEIVISGVSRSIDKQSIRVVGAQGAGTILEVAGNSTYPKFKDEELEKKKSEIDELEKELVRLSKGLRRIEKEAEWVDGFAQTLIKVSKGKENPYLGMDDFEKTEKFIQFYQNRLHDVDKRTEDTTLKVEEIKKTLARKKAEMSKYTSVTENDKVEEIVIVVYAKNPTKMALQVAYIITAGSARWTASYDARVTSGEQKLELNYYGNILNNSGEDWNNINLVLSTAQPSIAGKPPELYTKIVRLRPNFGLSPSFRNSVVMQSTISRANQLYDDEDDFSNSVPRSVLTGRSEVLTAKAAEAGTTSNFIIPRKSTILADGKQHKVMIRSLPFPADFTFTIIPKLSPHAYLKASFKNTERDVPLLSGPMNVFMDNNFVAKTDIPTISPNESLGVFLGVDPAIKIEYQPLKQLKDTQGYITKSNKLNVKFNTVITNNKAKELKIELFDNLPKSVDNQVKVKLIEPEILETPPAATNSTTTARTGGGWEEVSLTAANNVHWKLLVPPGGKKEVPFSYAIDYPIDSELENAF